MAGDDSMLEALPNLGHAPSVNHGTMSFPIRCLGFMSHRVQSNQHLLPSRESFTCGY